MSDRLGRLHKIIITQQWSESPQWHFHTTSDLWGNLWGHDQGQGSARASVIMELAGPSCRFFLSTSSVLSRCSFALLLSVCLSLTLSFTGRDQLRHPIPWVCRKESKRKSIGEWRPGGPIKKLNASLWAGMIHTSTYQYTALVLLTNSYVAGNKSVKTPKYVFILYL